MVSVKKIISLILVFVIAAVFVSCGDVKIEKTKYANTYFDYFDTVITIIAYCENDEEFEKIDSMVESLYDYYNKLYDIYNCYPEMSNAKTINDNAGIAPVTVDDDLIELISYAKDLYTLTDGNVNIAFGSVLHLWHEARELADYDISSAYVPDIEDLKAASLHCDIDNVIVDNNSKTVYLSDSEMSIDLGAIAKGYATELIAKKLISDGYTNIILSAGGNARTIGEKVDGSAWVVAIQNPDKTSDEYARTIQVKNMSVVTSGTYERYFELDGVRYHHIINKDTLFPENNYLSVTIVTEDSGFADALSTAVFNMSLEDGKSFIDGLDGVEAMWILNDYSQVCTKGFEEIIIK